MFERENDITQFAVDKSINMHRDIGAGIFEIVYEKVLAELFMREGNVAIRQVPIAINYEGIHFEEAFKADIIINNLVILEIKSEAKHNRGLYRKQLQTYLRLTGLKVGLVLNFGLPTMLEGIERVVNNY